MKISAKSLARAPRLARWLGALLGAAMLTLNVIG